VDVVEQVHGDVGGVHARGLGARHAAAVVRADGGEDACLQERLAGEDLAGVRVIDTEALALEVGPRHAAGVPVGDGVELVLAGGQGHDELAEIVEETSQVRGVGVGAGPAREGAGDGGHLAGVDVQQPA
jgi:hypothetical protein